MMELEESPLLGISSEEGNNWFKQVLLPNKLNEYSN